MADSRQFGSPRASQFGDKAPGNLPGDSAHCAECEAMLTDAVDSMLSPADQVLFDAHIAHCDTCSQLLADTRRGTAWLEMLRNAPPEPPATLVERILAQTTGADVATARSTLQQLPGAGAAPALLFPEAIRLTPRNGVPGAGAAYGKVIPFRSRVAAAVRLSPFGQIVLQPRLAMTAAMAFFSVALTMNLAGIHPLKLRASDFRPASLKRDYYSANARIVQYYEGLRVVYELESRVHDLESASDRDAPAGSQSVPESASPEPSVSPSEPGGQGAPSAKPGPADHSPSAQPEQKQRRPLSRSAPNSGTSRRESLSRTLVLADAIGCDGQFPTIFSTIPANTSLTIADCNSERVEGRLV